MKKPILLTLVISLCFLCACTTSSPNLNNSSPSTSPPNTSSPSLEELNYLTAFYDNQDMVLNAFGELLDLIPSKEWEPENDEWVDDVITQLAIIGVAYDEAIEMDTPDSMAQIHYKHIQAMSDYNDVTDLIISAIANLDTSIPDQAITKMESGTQHLKEAAVLIDAFMATF